MSWLAAYNALPDSWLDELAEAEDRWGTLAASRPEQFRALVEWVLVTLDSLRRRIDRLEAAASTPQERARVIALRRRWVQLAAPIYVDARVAAADEVGIAPAILVVVGIAIVAVAAICACLVAREYIRVLDRDVALQEGELNARVAASEQGRTLQPTTLRKNDDDAVARTARAAATASVVLLILGGAAVLWSAR